MLQSIIMPVNVDSLAVLRTFDRVDATKLHGSTYSSIEVVFWVNAVERLARGTTGQNT